ICQLGGATIDLEKHLIARDKTADLATFDIPDVLLGLANIYPHHPPDWPTQPLKEREAVILGGFPGSLREEKETVLETGFQVLALAVSAVSPDKVILHLDMPGVHWPFHLGEQMNANLGGMSGGGVYRIIEKDPIDRVELVGIIYEYNEALDVLFARPADFIA